MTKRRIRMSRTVLTPRPIARQVTGRHPLENQTGTALLTVILVTSAFLTLAVYGARSAQVELRIAHNETLAKQALGAAEAGVTHAYNLIVSGGGGVNGALSNGGTGGALAGIGNTVTLEDGRTYRFAAFGGSGATDGYYVRAVDDYDEPAGVANDPTTDVDNKIDVIARGRIGGAERIIQARISGSPVFPYALFGKQWINFSGGSKTDGYDSRNGAYSAAAATASGSIRSNGDITLSSGSTLIRGDAMATGTVSTSGGASVTGTTTNSAPTWNPPSVPACGPPYSASTGVTCHGNCTYTASTGALVVKNLGSYALLADGTYCFGTVNLSGGSTLQVNGPVVLYITGTFTTSGGGSVNNTTSLPSDFILYSSYNNLSNKNGVLLSGGSGSYMGIYAPDTGVTYSGGSDLYGAVVGGNFTYSGGSTIHYDGAMGSILSGSGLTAWHELRNW